MCPIVQFHNITGDKVSKKRVLGVSLHQGEFEGTPYNHMKFHVVSPFPPGKAGRVGFTVVELRADSALYQRASTLKFPIDLDMDVQEAGVGGGKSQSVVMSFEAPSFTATGKAA